MENKNCIYLLYETKQNLEESLEQCDKLIDYNKQLVEVFKYGIAKVKPSYADSFNKDFVSKLNEEIEGYKNQKIVLNEKLEMVKNTIAIYEKGNKDGAEEFEKMYANSIAQSITTMALILGAVKTETEQKIEREREENERKEREKERKRMMENKAKNVLADNVESTNE